MSRTLSPSFARCYGLARVARVWQVSRASVYRSLSQTPPIAIGRRRGPVGACSDAELADHIRRQIAISRLHGEALSGNASNFKLLSIWKSGKREVRAKGSGKSKSLSTIPVCFVAMSSFETATS
jgi:putative transposase